MMGPCGDWMKGALLAGRALPGAPPGTWSPASLSGDRFRHGPSARLAGFFLKLALGARPVLERISGSATALQINLVGPQRDLLLCRIGPDRSRLSHCSL